MKYVVCVPDGCSDQPVTALDGLTPLAAADMPVLAMLAARGEVGRAAVIPPGMPPGSDVGNMSILGFDPSQHHTGRAPIEAAALGLVLKPDEIAFRCNLVATRNDTMVDFAGGHPTNAQAADVIDALQEELGGDVTFHPGVQYRHIMVAPADWADAECVPPHDLTGDPCVLPSGPAGAMLTDLMRRSRAVLERFDVDATEIWLWGQGAQPQLPSFKELHGVRAGLVTAVDLVRGLGVLSGMDVVDLPSATGWYDTDYEGKRDVALKALAGDTDLFVIHVEATDEAGHAGNVEEKVKALENWDSRILAGLVEGLDALGPWRLLLMPDHATPVELMTHTPDPVPYLLVDSAHDGPGGTYTEAATADCTPLPGHELITRLLSVQK